MRDMCGVLQQIFLAKLFMQSKLFLDCFVMQLKELYSGH